MAPTMKLDPKYDNYDYPTTSPNVQSGHPGHTTPEQDAQVFQLRTQLEQAGYKERLDTLSMVRYMSVRGPQWSLIVVDSSDSSAPESSTSNKQNRCRFLSMIDNICMI